MGLDATHPDYDKTTDDQLLMRHCYQGERVVKEQGTKYLPPTPGHVLDGMGAQVTGTTARYKPGQAAYEAYKLRAVFHDFVSDAVEAYMGMLHLKPATFELPDGMKPLLERATNNGETLANLLRRVNEQQLVTGRLGLMADMPVTPDPANPMPYITLYIGEAVRNWDDSNDNQGVNELQLVVLDESGDERIDRFKWDKVEKYRVLALMEPPAVASVEGQDAPTVVNGAVAGRTYWQGVFRKQDGEFNPFLMRQPLLRGKPLEEIPFVFVNSKDITPTPDNPPLLGLGRLSLAIYRLEADYRYTLFMQGQETLVVIGAIRDTSGTDTGGADDGVVRVGAGARIDLDLHGDAKYVGISAEGLMEQREALKADKQAAGARAGQLITQDQKGGVESGDALSTRLAAQTASLKTIALTGAAALEKLLRIVAVWMGQDPMKVKVTPNLEFGDVALKSKELVELMTARTMGAPLSLQSIHDIMKERGLTKLEFEEELDLVAEEDAGRAALESEMPTPGSLAPGGPNDPNALQNKNPETP